MPQITLTSDEAAILGDVLANYLSDLRMEIAGTDRMEFREDLKRRETFLKTLLTALSQSEA